MNKWILVVLAAIPLMGCQLGVDQEEDTTVEVITLGSDAVSGEIDNDGEKYTLYVETEGKSFDLKGDIEELRVLGNENYVLILEDTQITKLVIQGETNTVTIQDGLQTELLELSITGNTNTVEVTTLSDSDPSVNGTGNVYPGS